MGRRQSLGQGPRKRVTHDGHVAQDVPPGSATQDAANSTSSHIAGDRKAVGEWGATQDAANSTSSHRDTAFIRCLPLSSPSASHPPRSAQTHCRRFCGARLRRWVIRGHYGDEHAPVKRAGQNARHLVCQKRPGPQRGQNVCIECLTTGGKRVPGSAFRTDRSSNRTARLRKNAGSLPPEV